MKKTITKEYYTEVSRRLQDVMAKKKISVADIVRLCAENGFEISQSAVSKLVSYSKELDSSITLINCVQVCRALDVPLEEILNHTHNKVNIHDAVRGSSEPASKRSPLVFNMREDEFRGYEGKFHTYFFPTISSEDELLHGELTFEPSDSGEYCAAKYILYTKQKDKNSELVKKEYEGELIISVRMRAGYCILYNTQIGEICFLIFHHMYLNNEDMKCRLATAVTTSAGDNRRPTMHRILLTRRELIKAEEISVARSQLLLNSSDILISVRAYEELCQQKELPDEMQDNEKFIRILPKEEYYQISESHIRALRISREEKVKALCTLRNISAARRYNKIGSKCDESVFEFLYKLYDEKMDNQDI